ncbi:MAG TPA: non-heme iron oxygenase ferredoxin subunit [Actinomycetota bacterium]|nr:non-heme iron oxygenase ferredoxin subunit [Actinomycetota bacterium]
MSEPAAAVLTGTRLVESIEYIAVAQTGDVPPGWVLKVQVGNREVALSNCDGTFSALDNFCTHAGGPLGNNRLGDGCQLECSWHNAQFDARTGAVISGPARKPLRKYTVKVKDGTVYVAIAD